jgi:hypothetical protein
VAAAIKRQRERMLDLCELKLYAAIQQGESWAIQYFLRTIGKHRGYVERTEHTGADGDDLHPTIQLYWSEPELQPAVYLPRKNGGAPDHDTNGHDPVQTPMGAHDEPSQAPPALPAELPSSQEPPQPEPIATNGRLPEPPPPRQPWKPI